MATQIPLKLYLTPASSGFETDSISALPEYGSIYGKTAINSYQDLTNAAKGVLQKYKDIGEIGKTRQYGDTWINQYSLTPYNTAGGDTLLEKLNNGTATPDEIYKVFSSNTNWSQSELDALKSGITALQGGTQAQSQYVIDPTTGNMTTQQAIDEQAKNEAAVAAGTMKKVPVGNGWGYVPTGSAGDLNMANIGTNNTSESLNKAAGTDKFQTQPQVLGNQMQNQGMSYKIVAGDTLSGIAQRNGTTVQALMQANPQISDPNKIYAGQSINLPGNNSNTGYTNSNTGNNGTTGSSATPTVTYGDSMSNQSTTQPAQTQKSFADTYAEALKTTGVSDIKTSYDNAVKKQSDLTNEMNDKIATVDENPWMSQSVKDRERERIKSRYETRLNTLSNEQQLYNSLYQQSLAEAKFLTTGEVEEQQNIAKAIQDAEEAKAKLYQQAIDNKQSALRVVNGGLYDTDTRTWVIAPKETTGSTGDYNDLLSPSDASALGVPYGTTKGQAASMGITPQGKTTQAQQTVSGYATRIEQANSILNSLTNIIKGYNPIQFAAEMASPTSYLKTSTIQQYDQASRNLINAILRRESGAVISDQEFANARQQYLPQPGDKEEVIKQKQQNIMSVLNSYKNAAGNAYQSVNDLLSSSNDPLGIR